MKITVYNFKGGVGKTCIAANLALTMQYGIITNDVFSPMDRILDDKHFLKLTPNQPIPKLPDEYNIIFDLGGYVDSRVITAVKQSQWVLIPMVRDFLTMQAGINCINEVQQFNKNIIVIANRILKGEEEEIKKAVLRFFSYPIFSIKQSTALSNIFELKMSIEDMIKQSGLWKYHYQAVTNQFNSLIQYMKGMTHDSRPVRPKNRR